MTLYLARLFLVVAVVGASKHSKPPNHPDFRPNELTLHHEEATFCGICKWGNMDFDCDYRVKYLIQHWKMTEENSKQSLLDAGECQPTATKTEDVASEGHTQAAYSTHGGGLFGGYAQSIPEAEEAGTMAASAAPNANADSEGNNEKSPAEGAGTVAAAADPNENANFEGDNGPSPAGGAGAAATAASSGGKEIQLASQGGAASAAPESSEETNSEGSNGQSPAEGSGAAATAASSGGKEIQLASQGGAASTTPKAREETVPPRSRGLGGATLLAIALINVVVISALEYRRRKGLERKLLRFQSSVEEEFRQYQDRESVRDAVLFGDGDVPRHRDPPVGKEGRGDSVIPDDTVATFFGDHFGGRPSMQRPRYAIKDGRLGRATELV